MDTKLKNNNKRRKSSDGHCTVDLICRNAAFLSGVFFLYNGSGSKRDAKKKSRCWICWIRFWTEIICYIMKISNETESSEVIEEYGNSRFGLMKKYMKYGIFDESGTAMLTSDESAKKLPEEFDGDTYALCVRFSFDVDGDISDIQVGGTAYDKNLQFTAEQWLYDNSVYSAAASYISTPSEVEIMYAMTEQNLEAYLEQYETSNDMYAYMYVDELMQQPSFNWSVLILQYSVQQQRF